MFIKYVLKFSYKNIFMSTKALTTPLFLCWSFRWKALNWLKRKQVASFIWKHLSGIFHMPCMHKVQGSEAETPFLSPHST